MRRDFDINCLSNAGDMFRLALRRLNTHDEQRLLMSCVDRLHSDVRVPAAREESMERQLAAHSAELASVCGSITRLEKSVSVVPAQRQLADDQ